MVEEGRGTHDEKEGDSSYFKFKENEESKLLRKFLIKWETYFNKSRQEIPTSGIGKKTKGKWENIYQLKSGFWYSTVKNRIYNVLTDQNELVYQKNTFR